MNLIISLQKILGSKQTKIKAIGFEIQQLEDEIKYALSQSAQCIDQDEIQYWVNHSVELRYQIIDKHDQIERLQK